MGVAGLFFKLRYSNFVESWLQIDLELVKIWLWYLKALLSNCNWVTADLYIPKCFLLTTFFLGKHGTVVHLRDPIFWCKPKNRIYLTSKCNCIVQKYWVKIVKIKWPDYMAELIGVEPLLRIGHKFKYFFESFRMWHCPNNTTCISSLQCYGNCLEEEFGWSFILHVLFCKCILL